MNPVYGLPSGRRTLTDDENFLLKEGLLIGMCMLDRLQGLRRVS